MKLLQRISLERSMRKIRFSRDGSGFLSVTQEIVSYYKDGVMEAVPLQASDVPDAESRYIDAAYLNDEQLVLTYAYEYDDPIYSYETGDPDVSIYDLKTQSIISKINIGEGLNNYGSICVDQQRGRIFISQADSFIENNILIYDRSLNLTGKFSLPYWDMLFEQVISLSGDKLAVMGTMGILVWDVADTPKLIVEAWPSDSDCIGNACKAKSVDITPDGRYVVGGFQGAHGIFSILDTESGKITSWYTSQDEDFNIYDTGFVAISHDAKYVAVTERNTTIVRIYSVEDGSIVYRFDPQERGIIIFSPASDILAFYNANSISLWEFEG
jgi:hypothetical protein